MLSLQSPKILNMYASERAAQLRRAPVGAQRDSLRVETRRLGKQLVRIGAWVTPKPIVAQAPEAA